MNKYIRGLVVIPCGFVKMTWTKLFHMSGFRGPLFCQISPFTEITLERGAVLRIGKGFKMRDQAKIRVRRGGRCEIGEHTSVNSGNWIVCRESVRIGSDCQLAPNVQIYDHDHDFRHPGGLGAMKYRTAPVEIGNRVWIGANTVILRGTTIGDDCVIGAGCIVKGEVPAGTRYIQKRETTMSEWERDVENSEDRNFDSHI